jgi:Flp pilus assembly pilin Flp
MADFLPKLWSQEEGQDIAEYAVMLAVILVIVVGTRRLIGGKTYVAVYSRNLCRRLSCRTSSLPRSWFESAAACWD